MLSVALSLELVSLSAQAVDSCSDAFGAVAAAVAVADPAPTGRLKVRSEDEVYKQDAQATLQAVDAFLEPSGLLTPKLINFTILPADPDSTSAQFQVNTATIRMKAEFANLSPLATHGAFVHEYGHAVFEYTAMRDSASYRSLIRAMAGFKKVSGTLENLQARQAAAIAVSDFEQTSQLRLPLKTAQAEAKSFVELNLRDLKVWNFGGVFQEAFADLVPVLYFKNPEILGQVGANPLRIHAESISPEHWMEQNAHYALVPFVRHVVQRTLVQGDIGSTEALKLVHQLLLRRIEKVRADPSFATQPPDKLSRVDKINQEAYIYGYRVSDLNIELIRDFDTALFNRK